MLLLFTLLSIVCSADSTTPVRQLEDATLLSARPAAVHLEDNLPAEHGSPENQSVSQMKLGEEYETDGDFQRAAEAYERSLLLVGDPDMSRVRKLAAVNDWMRNYGVAQTWLEKGLSLRPSDQEMQQDIFNLQARRSLHLFGSFGGSDVDFARRARELGVFVGWVDWLDLYVTYSTTDRIFYQKRVISVDAYFYPAYDLSLRLGLRNKFYSYPQASTFPPDENAYEQVPALQFEAGYTYAPDNVVSVELEYFRPNFYWNRVLYSDNFKLSANLRNWVVKPVYLKLFAAVLRDPDPGRFTVESATGVVQSFAHEQVHLLGAGMGFDDGRMEAEIKFVPDRDLDRSLDWSVFGRLQYNLENVSIQYDLLIDKYPAARSVTKSRVNMLTVFLSPSKALDLRVGAKLLTRQTTEVAPFVYIRYRTGISGF